MSLRPEKITLLADGQGAPEGWVSLDGRLASASYQGSVTRLAVDADGVRITAAVPAGSAPIVTGSTLRLAWPKAAMVLLEGEP